MSTDTRARRNAYGFTLVELLVVIAIIGILASIVVPNVVRYMAKARVARALAEVKGAEQALTAALTDTKRTNFSEFLNSTGYAILSNPTDGLALPGNFEVDGDPLTANLERVQRFYNIFFYELLRQGRNSDFIQQYVKPEIRQKLGTSYMDIGNDPWGNQYNFWMGPQRGPSVLRSYRLLDGEDPESESFNWYVYTGFEKNTADKKLPGNPKADNSLGFPAPRDRAIYIYSAGPNGWVDSIHFPAGLSPIWDNQVPPGMPNENFPEFWGGGDDVNNWDSTNGWEDAPQ